MFKKMIYLENYPMSDFSVGDIVYVSPKSLASGTDSNPIEWLPECVKIIKKTPKRFKVEWDCDGQIDEPIVVYVKYVYKNPEDVFY